MKDGPIRAAVKQQVQAIGSLRAAADAIDGLANKSQLERYYPGKSDRVPVVVAVALDLAAGEPAILDAAARKLGFRLVPLEAEDAAADAIALSADASVDMANLHRLLLDILRDGVVTPNERKEALAKLAPIFDVLRNIETAIGGGK